VTLPEHASSRDATARVQRLCLACAAVGALVLSFCWLVGRLDRQRGLDAAYFSSLDGTGQPILVHHERRPSSAEIDRAWHGAPPDQFSARWQGTLAVPRAGRYTFATSADGGAALMIDEERVFDSRARRAPEAESGSIGLSAGSHTIQLDYVQAGDAHDVQLRWALEHGALAEIPAAAFHRERGPGDAFVRIALLADAAWTAARACTLLALSIVIGISARHRVRPSVLVSIAMLTVPAAMIAAAARAVWRLYSPVPFYDEWDAVLAFVLDVEDGRGGWWSQFNEHRLLLTRLIEYPLTVALGGRQWLLAVLSFALIATGGLLLIRLRQADRTPTSSSHRLAFGCVMLGWLYLWSQRETLAWGFNIAFVLAMVLAVAALYPLAHRQGSTSPTVGERVVAGMCGLCAVASMANGVLVLPCLVAYAWWQRLGRGTVAAYAVLTLGGLVAYAHGYVTPPEHGSIVTALATQPLAIAEFVFLFLGAPFRWLAGTGATADAIGVMAGATYVLLWLLIARSLWMERGERPVHTAAWLIATYVIATAAVTGVGRTLMFGAESALWSRYSTAAVWGWAALGVWVDARLAGRGPTTRRVAAVLATIFAVGMVTRQLFEHDDTGGLFTPHREVSGLALAMQVHDLEVIQRVHFSPTWIMELAGRAQARHLSMFGAYPYRDLSGQMGQPFTTLPPTPCLGAIQKVERISSDEGTWRVHGWLVGSAGSSRMPYLVRLVYEGRTVGFALDELPRPTIGDPTAADPGSAGFVGYLRANAAAGPLWLVGDDPACAVSVMVPAPHP
jgi:hypothetical protein